MSNTGRSPKLKTCDRCKEDVNLQDGRHFNRPGLPALSYRLGTHAGILHRMLARLANQVVPPGESEGGQPLSELTTRTIDDPVVALLDAWAVIGDVLAFYQERIANEGYIGTATERRSVLEQARAIGYELNPGVAASTYLAFTVEDAPGAPGKANVPKGTRIQSIPGQDELPQTFETVEEIEARAEWNALRPYRPVITEELVIENGITELRLNGVHTHLKPGDGILIIKEQIEDGSQPEAGDYEWAFRILKSASPFPEKCYTLVSWEEILTFQASSSDLTTQGPLIHIFQRKAHLFGYDAPDWKSLPNEKKKTILSASPNSVTCVAFSTDGRYGVSACTDGAIKLWDVGTGEEIRTFTGHEGPVNCVAFSPGGSDWIYSGGADGKVIVWDVESGNKESEYIWDNVAVTSITCWDREFPLPPEVGSFKRTDLVAEPSPEKQAATATGFSPLIDKKVGIPQGKSRTWILAGYENGSLRLWPRANELLPDGPLTFIKHTKEVTSVAFAPNGSQFVSGSGDTKVILWNITSEDPIREFTEHHAAVTSVAYSPDGNQILSGSLDKTIRIRSAGAELYATLKMANTETNEDNTETYTLEGHTLGVTSLAVLPTSLGESNTNTHNIRWILSGSQDQTIMLWMWDESLEDEENKWRAVRYFAGHTAAVTSVAFSPDGRSLLSGSVDSTLKLWEVGLEVTNGAEVGREILAFAGHAITDQYRNWPGFTIDESKNQIDLDKVYPKLGIDSWIVLETPDDVEAYKVTEASSVKREDYTLAAKVTHLVLDTSVDPSLYPLRDTDIYVEGEAYDLFKEQIQKQPKIEGDTIKDSISKSIVLDSLVLGLAQNQALGITGKRMRAIVTDKAADAGLTLEAADGTRSEVLETDDILEILAPPEPGAEGEWTWQLKDKLEFSGSITTAGANFTLVSAGEDDETVSEVGLIEICAYHQCTTITLKNPLKNMIDPATMIINANVVQATHGETVKEVLGSGDGTKANQRFMLKKPPLTYVQARTPSGGENTLEVLVNDVLWEGVPSLNDLDERNQSYVVRHDNDGNSTVIFGDGKQGARLPSAMENVKATYRSGLGPDGEVAEGSLSLLQHRPLGIRGVTNPQPASGAAEAESLEYAQARAPRTVLTMGRIVSLQDFEDFAGTFAGIGKAQAVPLWRGENRLVHITIAAASGEMVDEGSAHYNNLLEAINAFRDPVEEVQVASYKLRPFRLKASVMIDERYLEKKVLAQAKSALKSAFSFEKRSIGQNVTKAEIVSEIHRIEGVIAIDVDEFYFKGEPPPEGEETEPKDSLQAESARWDDGQVLPGELLLIDPPGITLEPMER